MNKRKKILSIILIVLAVSLTGLGIFGYYFLRSGVPIYDEAVILEELSEEVGVHYTGRGVPYIAAVNESDLYLMQGYLHAKERMWQMELQRRVVQGRLSEVLGEDQLQADRFLKTINLEKIAGQMLKNTSLEGRAAIESYCTGVNAYLDTHPPSLEFRLLGFKPEPWSPLDSAGIISLMAFDLGSNWRAEMFRQALAEEIAPDLLEEIVPPYEDWESPRVLSSFKNTEHSKIENPGQSLLDILNKTSLEHLYTVPRLGSNSWVISPRLSATGSAVLANDPHLNLGLPSIWFENAFTLREEKCDMDLYGWSIPGAPGVVVGHNRSIAWGLTNTGDTQDLFIEKRHPEDPQLFEYAGEWYEADLETTEIIIKGREEPERLEIIHTRNGPLISEDPPMSLRWTAYDVETSTIDAVLKLNKASDWEQFKNALAHFSLPVQSFVYADVEGNIGFRVAGLLPVRKQGQGIMPSPGWKDNYGWEKYIPYEEMPELYNPEKGFIVAANNRIEPDDYPYLISMDNAPGYRKQRITEVLAELEEIEVEDSKMLQTDWYNRHAYERLPSFLEILHKNGPTFSRVEQEALDVMVDWAKNPINERGSAGAAIFQLWYLNLMEEIFKAEMGDQLYLEFLKQGYIASNAMEALLEKDKSGWFPEGLDKPLTAAFSDTVNELSKTLGEEPQEWRWDELQNITFEHDLGVAPLIGNYLFNRGPYPYGGDFMTVGRARYAFDEPFEVINGAGLRFIAVMEIDHISSEVVIAGGQSGHPLSPHYCDQLETWLSGEYYQVQIPCEVRLTWEEKTRYKPGSE